MTASRGQRAPHPAPLRSSTEGGEEEEEQQENEEREEEMSGSRRHGRSKGKTREEQEDEREEGEEDEREEVGGMSGRSGGGGATPRSAPCLASSRRASPWRAIITRESGAPSPNKERGGSQGREPSPFGPAPVRGWGGAQVEEPGGITAPSFEEEPPALSDPSTPL
ncbi:unnamed protein product [Lampetra planeri]